MKDFAVDAAERCARAFASSVLAVLAVGDGLNVLHADWLDALGVGLGAAVVSLLTSLAALKIGSAGTASLTRAVVSADYADAIARGRHEANLRNGPK